MIKIETNENNYDIKLNDLDISIEHDLNEIHSGHLLLIEREGIRSNIYEKRIQLHKEFYNSCMQIMNDIYSSHVFEYASSKNFELIKIETQQSLLLFYNRWQHKINKSYFDIVLIYELNDEIYQNIKNNIYLSEDYLYLDNYYTKINHYMMLNYLYQIIK